MEPVTTMLFRFLPYLVADLRSSRLLFRIGVSMHFSQARRGRSALSEKFGEDVYLPGGKCRLNSMYFEP